MGFNALSHVLNLVKNYTRQFPVTDKPGLLLMGDGTGTGKTHLAVAAFRAILAKGFSGVFFDYSNLLDRIRKSYDSASGIADREAYRTALDAEILLLDDLGSQRGTEWVQDTVTSLITYRYNHQKPLIATSNMPDPAGFNVIDGANTCRARWTTVRRWPTPSAGGALAAVRDVRFACRRWKTTGFGCDSGPHSWGPAPVGYNAVSSLRSCAGVDTIVRLY
jgi:chromosomal replication initiation ATPase DnaA